MIDVIAHRLDLITAFPNTKFINADYDNKQCKMQFYFQKIIILLSNVENLVNKRIQCNLLSSASIISSSRMWIDPVTEHSSQTSTNYIESKITH